MSKWLIRVPLKLLKWAFCMVGALALLLTALVATPLPRLPELASISAARGTVDFSTLPAVERFQARTALAGFPSLSLQRSRYRPRRHRDARLVRVQRRHHPRPVGNPGARGVETFAVDIRGHGASGTRGDIGYVGQLEDDLADFVAVVRKTAPTAPLTLVGHSSGGGFALRVAGSPIQHLFERTVLLAPYLATMLPPPGRFGGWAKADIPRILGLDSCAPSASPAARRCRCWRSRCRRIPRRRWWGPIPTG